MLMLLKKWGTKIHKNTNGFCEDNKTASQGADPKILGLITVSVTDSLKKPENF